MEETIRDAGEVTPERLTSALQANGVLPQGEVTGIHVVGSFETPPSVMTRLEVTYAGEPAGLPSRLLLKVPKAERLPASDREVFFYRDVAPTMDPPPAARCFDAAYDPATGSYHLLIEDVTLHKEHQIDVHVRFKAGAVHSLSLPIPPNGWQAGLTSPQVIDRLDHLLDAMPESDAVDCLNEQGMRPGLGERFNRRIIRHLQQQYGLRTHYERLRDKGLLTPRELAGRLGVSISAIATWRKQGRLTGHRVDANHRHLYEDPGDDIPVKYDRAPWQTKQPNLQTTAR